MPLISYEQWVKPSPKAFERKTAKEGLGFRSFSYIARVSKPSVIKPKKKRVKKIN
jgi:hypothetical protein